MITLTSTREAKAALAEPRQPLRVRVIPHTRGDKRWYEMNNWLPVPAWARRFDGWTVGAVVRLVLAAMVGAAALVWWLLRLLGRAR